MTFPPSSIWSTISHKNVYKCKTDSERVVSRNEHKTDNNLLRISLFESIVTRLISTVQELIRPTGKDMFRNTIQFNCIT